MKLKHILILLSFLSIFFACNRFKNAEPGELSFENDTVFFDTIFTQVGSTTKIFEVYNNTNKAIKIDQVFLAAGENSKYRLNIDGSSENNAKNITINAKDSLFIFIEVTINSAKDDLIEEDSIIFISGNNRQRVVLDAVGKDVHLINGALINTQTWIADKPYLIYNSILIDSLQTLTIDKGVEIYLHRNSNIYVKGTLNANGDKDNEIKLRGDRIDDDYYTDKPGQWGGILFLYGSNNNILNYLKITEATIGIYIDSMLNDLTPTVVISNSEISHCSYSGIYALNTYCEGYNLVISDCGVYNIGLLMSGIYNFYNCTIQNDYSSSIRNSPTVGVQNFYVDNNERRIYGGHISAYFTNCIIYGNLKNELVISEYDTTNSMTFLVENSLLKIDLSVIDTSLSMYKNIIANSDPLYVDKDKFNFHLSIKSPAINKANLQVDNSNSAFLQFDKDGIDRLSANKPDIGAFEYVP